MRGPGSKPSLLFQLVIPATAVFVITILSLIAVVFSDPRAPLAQLLNRHGNTLLVGEFVVVIHPAPAQASSGDGERVLKLLMTELPLKTAVKLAAEISGESKNLLYDKALAFKA